jgi:recombination protein RecR
MTKLDKLIRYFEQFPGIGARQAKRFAFHVLMLPSEDKTQLATLIEGIADEVIECTSCRRFFSRQGGDTTECNICRDNNRDRSRLLVVEKDNDIVAIERAGAYEGLYFVLGGTAPLLENKENTRLRSNGLKHVVTHRKDSLSEIILGFAINPDGDNTARFVEKVLKDILADSAIRVTHLGRGLSTGSELEYADGNTLLYALKNRF